VQLVGLDPEGRDGTEDGLGEQARAIRVEQPVESTAHPVVVQHRGVGQAEQLGVVGLGPLRERVERAMTTDDVATDERPTVAPGESRRRASSAGR